MAHFQYFATLEDSLEILRDLCAQGFGVVAEPGPFETPEAPIFDHVDDALVALLGAAPNYYLTGRFARFPVQFSQFQSGPAEGKFGVNLLAQGPLMQALMGRLRVVDGKPSLLPGDASYERAYRNPETQAWETASPELKVAYRAVVATFKKRCPRYAYRGGAELFVGAEARRLIEGGEAHIDEALIIK